MNYKKSIKIPSKLIDYKTMNERHKISSSQSKKKSTEINSHINKSNIKSNVK